MASLLPRLALEPFSEAVVSIAPHRLQGNPWGSYLLGGGAHLLGGGVRG